MAFCRCERKSVHFLVLSIYLWSIPGLRATVEAETNRSDIKVDIQDGFRFRTLPTQGTTAYRPVEQPSTSSGEEALLSRRKRINPTEITPKNKLPESVRLRLKTLLSTQMNSVKVPEKQSIRLQCNTQFVRSIRARYSDTEFIWSHNRRWLHPDGVKYVLVNGDLLINDTSQTLDQGVYVCQLLSRGKWRVTMAIYALAVSPSATVYRVVAGSELEVFCDSQTLGKIYRGSTRTWSLNGSAVANLTGIDARVDSADRVYNVQQNHSGLWACSVIRADNPNKYWQTNQIVVEVSPKPSWWRSMVNRFPLPIVAESFGFALFLCSLFLCAIAAMKRVKQGSPAYANAYSYQGSTIMASTSVSLRCQNRLTNLIYQRFPMADLFWEFNSQPLRADPSRMLYKPLVNELTILDAGPEDSGIYTCKMAQNWYWTQTVNLFVVQVASFKPTIELREREALTLTCNSDPLHELFTSVNRTWYHNGQMVCSDTGTEGEQLILHHTMPTDGGVWECMVSNHRRTWLTSRMNVSVLAPLSHWELVQSQSRFMVGAAALVFAGCVVFFFICFGLAYWSNRRDNQERLYFAEWLDIVRKRKEET